MTRCLFLFVAISAWGQPWSAFLDPTRAVDWTTIGVGFTIPSYTVNCATQPVLTANSPTSDAANTTAIQNALGSCDATHNVVNIPAGTYYVAGWTYGIQGHQVVRGAGPTATTIILTTRVGCSGTYPGICMISSNPIYGGNGAVIPPSGTQQCMWTGTNGSVGTYTMGATSLILNSCPSPPPLNQTLILDQQNDTADTSGIFICDNNGYAGCAIEGGGDGRVIPPSTGVTYSQQQVVYTTAVSGTGTGPYTVTISTPVYFSNLRSSQTPGAWWPGFVQNDGLENLTVDTTTMPGAGYNTTVATTDTGTGTSLIVAASGSFNTLDCFSVGTATPHICNTAVNYSTNTITLPNSITRSPGDAVVLYTDTYFGSISLYNCYQCWVRNIRSVWGARNHIYVYQSLQDVIRDSYFYQSQGHVSTSYVVELEESSGVLVENNIFQQVTNPIMQGQASGSVVGYNFSFNNQYYPTTWMQATYASHNAGNEMNLYEGNNFNGIWADNIHGSSTQSTYFRNFLNGWELGKTVGPFYTIRLAAWNRAFNVVGNILGQPTIQGTYESYATSTTGGINSGTASTSIFEMGWSDVGAFGSCTSSPVCDPIVRPTLMRWGNYDTVNSAIQWNSTEASPAAVPYANANFTASYFSTLAHTLPNSLYYTAKPSWWPSSKNWPPIGPDVSSGNIGICTGTYAGVQATSSAQCTGGTLTTAWASHATSVPAQDCYISIGGPPDGSGNALPFNANVCYYGAVAPPIAGYSGTLSGTFH